MLFVLGTPVTVLPFYTFIVKLAEYPALRAGMNAKRQLHENSRTTALEIFGKSSRTLRAIFQLARFNRYQAKTGFPNEPHADVRLANIAHHSLPEAANPCTLRNAQGHRISVTLRSEVCHTAMLSGKPDARAPMKSHMARVAPKCHGLFGKSDM